MTPYGDLDRAAYPFRLRRNDGWFTPHASHAVRQDITYDDTLTPRPLTERQATTGPPAGG